MYKAKLWDEDKWDIHSSYNSAKFENIFSGDKKDDKKYFEQKYGSEGKNAPSDYMRKENEKNTEENKQNIEFNSEEEKNERKEISEDDVPFEAAQQIFNEAKHESKKIDKHKETSTIEDAIKKAIEEEKKVIVIDN